MMHRITLAGGPRDGATYESHFPIEAGEVFLSTAGPEGGRYIALGEPEVGADGKLEMVVYWEPASRRRANWFDLLAAALAGIGIGLGLAAAVYLMLGLGWVAEALTALLGGMVELVLYSMLAGFIITVGWALIDPRIMEPTSERLRRETSN